MSLQSLNSPSGCDPSMLKTVDCFSKYSNSFELSRQVCEDARCEDALEPTLLTARNGAWRIPRPQPRGQSGPLSKSKGAFTDCLHLPFHPRRASCDPSQQALGQPDSCTHAYSQTYTHAQAHTHRHTHTYTHLSPFSHPSLFHAHTHLKHPHTPHSNTDLTHAHIFTLT